MNETLQNPIFRAACVMAFVIMPVKANAQLVHQSVEGIWRVCEYGGYRSRGSIDPKIPLNTEMVRRIRVGRGEPCPNSYPKYREEERARPTPPPDGLTQAEN